MICLMVEFHYGEVIRAIRRPIMIKIEVLIPDFQGDLIPWLSF
jgi:lipoate synthase